LIFYLFQNPTKVALLPFLQTWITFSYLCSYCPPNNLPLIFPYQLKT
jgi:hypothetical protein